MSISIPIIDGIFRVIDKLIPDPVAKAQAQAEALRMQQAGEFKQIETDLALALGQLEVNKIEAAAPDTFRGGWRPFIGWTCGGGLFYQILARPLFGWIAENTLGWTQPPSLEMDTLLTLLFGMLGLGGMRTMERLKGKV